jgi:N utilization substance protein B
VLGFNSLTILTFFAINGGNHIYIFRMTGHINSKTIARIAVVQALYQYQSNGGEQGLDELISSISSYYKDGEMRADLGLNSLDIKIKLNINYFSEILRYAIDNVDSTDDLIKEHLAKEWTMEGLHASLLALLRAAITELRYFPEVPYKVVINEFTDIASDLLQDSEVAFVNSLLDTVHNDIFPSDLIQGSSKDERGSRIKSEGGNGELDDPISQ